MTYRSRCTRRRELTMKPHTRCRMGWHVWRNYHCRIKAQTPLLYRMITRHDPDIIMMWMCQRCGITVKAVDMRGRIDFVGHRHGIAYLKRQMEKQGIPIVEHNPSIMPDRPPPPFFGMPFP